MSVAACRSATALLCCPRPCMQESACMSQPSTSSGGVVSSMLCSLAVLFGCWPSRRRARLLDSRLMLLYARTIDNLNQQQLGWWSHLVRCCPPLQRLDTQRVVRCVVQDLCKVQHLQTNTIAAVQQPHKCVQPCTVHTCTESFARVRLPLCHWLKFASKAWARSAVGASATCCWPGHCCAGAAVNWTPLPAPCHSAPVQRRNN